MKLKVGDQVKFLNDTGGGTVTKILNKEMVQVLNGDGFEVPVPAEELLKTEQEQPQLQNQQQQTYASGEEEEGEGEGEEETYDAFDQEAPQSKPLSSSEDPGNHMYFAFVPHDPAQPQQYDLETYLINDSDFHLFYLILIRREESWVYFASGHLEDNMKTFLKNIEQEHLNEIGRFRFQCIFYQKGFYQPLPPMESDLNVHPKKFFKSSMYTESDFFEEKAMVLEVKKEEGLQRKLAELSPEVIEQVVREKEQSDHRSNDAPHTQTRKARAPEDTEEVDLHIEELVDKPKALSNQEMLDIQMGRFQMALEGALKTPKTKKIVFIHGVGNGRLRYEIRKYLDRYYPRLDYQDASFKEYGYGATLVFVGK